MLPRCYLNAGCVSFEVVSRHARFLLLFEHRVVFFGAACLLIEPNCQPCKVTLSDFQRSQHVMSARSKRQRCQNIPHAALFIQASCKQTGKMPNRLLQPYDARWISRCLLSFDCSSAHIPWAMAKFKFETPSRQPEARSDAACLGLRICCSIRNL